MFNHILLSILLLTTNSFAGNPASFEDSNSQLDLVLSEFLKTKNSSILHSVDPRVRLLPHELITHYGYKGESHTTKTEDGYKLTLHRIVQNSKKENLAGKPAILLQHGIFGSSMDWIITGPGRSLAFILADLGFDVWLSNSRGNRYSNEHLTKSIDHPKFWEFSWHEMGYYDLPATIDHILMNTTKQHIIYIGHGQGCTISYVLLSERPEYNGKILVQFSLAPIVFGSHVNSILKFVASHKDMLHNIFSFIKNYDYKDWNPNLKSLAYRLCNENYATREDCKSIIFLLGGTSEKQFDEKLFPLILQHFPTGLNVKQVVHFNQMINSGRFHQYDHGSKNVMMYNSAAPPDYNLKNVKVPTVIFYSSTDLLTDPQRVQKLVDQLQREIMIIGITDVKFNHFDFLWGKNVKQLVYDQLTRTLFKYVNRARKLSPLKSKDDLL